MEPETLPGLVQPQESTQQDVGPDRREQLKSLVDQLNSKRGQSNAIQFSNKNQAESSRQESLAKVFEIMQKNGIDPNNMDEVKAFLDEIEQNNPELYKIFVQAFETLLGSEDPTGAIGQEPPVGPTEPSPDMATMMGGMASPGGMPPGISGQFPNLAQPPQG